MWTVYLLKSAGEEWYYVGSTNDIKRRLYEHNAKKVRSTKGHVPLELVYQEGFADESSARAFEHKLKKQRLLKERRIRTINEQRN